MNLSEMRTIVRRDLHDEDAGNYRWTDDELDRHIQINSLPEKNWITVVAQKSES